MTAPIRKSLGSGAAVPYGPLNTCKPNASEIKISTIGAVIGRITPTTTRIKFLLNLFQELDRGVALQIKPAEGMRRPPAPPVCHRIHPIHIMRTDGIRETFINIPPLLTLYSPRSILVPQEF
ncbi:hypothetical protein Zmor_020349 [Zophobas morio]|uniref:Uncharacterized protein n=1 Tax=Zophobas morio TaxID=2755281 RepID=A0AA38I7J0_9CUCU|nr:hypothetical protein Zmor_020349 [Zophobas morio]